MLLKLQSAIEAYPGTYGTYPPDGFDAPAFRADGVRRVQIRGSQCLVYFLGYPTVRVYEVGSERRTRPL